MKQSGKLASLRVKASEIRTFVQIAVVTGKSEVVCCVRPSMLSGNHVLHVESQSLLLLRQSAIFAVIVRTPPYELAKSGIHQLVPACLKMRRALA